MSTEKFFDRLDVSSRRTFLKIAAMAGISSSVLMAGSSSTLAVPTTYKGKADCVILNVALGLEYQAIAAYKAGAGLLSDATKPIALKFLAQHEHHRDALQGAVKAFGGDVEPEKKDYDIGGVAKKLGIELKGEGDVLMLAAKLEAGATAAYLANIAKLKETAAIDAAAKIAADEASHTAVLNFALKNLEAAYPGYLK